MSNYVLDRIEATRWKVVSQQNGKHFLQLHYHDLNRSFAAGQAGRREWFKTLDEADVADINNSNQYEIETKAMSAAELKETARALLEHINIQNREIEETNTARVSVLKDLISTIRDMIGDTPFEGEE